MGDLVNEEGTLEGLISDLKGEISQLKGNFNQLSLFFSGY